MFAMVSSPYLKKETALLSLLSNLMGFTCSSLKMPTR